MPRKSGRSLTLIVYLIPLHGRFAGWVNTFWLVFASVFCFLSVIMAWYGVNFVIGVGLHSYGFTEGGSQGSMLIIVACVLALPIAAAWRRHLGTGRCSEGRGDDLRRVGETHRNAKVFRWVSPTLQHLPPASGTQSQIEGSIRNAKTQVTAASGGPGSAGGSAAIAAARSIQISRSRPS